MGGGVHMILNMEQGFYMVFITWTIQKLGNSPSSSDWQGDYSMLLFYIGVLNENSLVKSKLSVYNLNETRNGYAGIHITYPCLVSFHYYSSKVLCWDCFNYILWEQREPKVFSTLKSCHGSGRANSWPPPYCLSSLLLFIANIKTVFYNISLWLPLRMNGFCN